MRAALDALTEELRRLKESGVSRVSVSAEGLAALERTMRGLRAGGPPPTAEPLAAAAAKAEPPRPPKPAVAGGPPPPVLAEIRARLQALPDKVTRWEALCDLVRQDPHCRAQLRPGAQLVVGVGSVDAPIFFVGEAPGAEEEAQGEPFVGPAGQLLNRMITGMGLQRRDVYIGNIMNWRPQLAPAADGTQVGNRPPTAAEMAYCLPYLLAQIEVVDPAIIVALGATAAQGLLGAGAFKTLGEIRGHWREFAGKPLIVTYHPSYILRNQTNRTKRMIWEDLLKVMERAGLAISDKQRRFFLEK
jgi:DNA polymerase